MNKVKTKIHEEACYKVVRLLNDNSDLTQRDFAKSFGVGFRSVNYSLKALVNKSWVKMKNFPYSKNEFSYIYVLTPNRLAQKVLIIQRFLRSKIDKYEALKVEIEVLISKEYKEYIVSLSKANQ